MPPEENQTTHSLPSARTEDEMEIDDAKCTCVRISEFYSPKVVAFDLFLKLGSGRYLRVFRAGEPYAEADLRGYETDRGIRHVYFGVENRARYVTSSSSLLQKLIPVAAVPLQTKFGVARILSELYLQQLFECPEEQRAALVEKGKEICALLAGWVETEPKLEGFLLRLEAIEPTTEGLAFLTGLFAGVASRRFPWKSRRTSETLLLAAFLADVGIAALPPEVARLKGRRMNAAQRQEFERHPDLSYEMLKKAGNVGENILLIVREHAEYCDGSGYPHKLTGNKLLQLSKLLTLSADVVRAASDNLLPISEAVKILFPQRSAKIFTESPEMVVKYDRDMLLPFFNVFGKEEGAV